MLNNQISSIVELFYCGVRKKSNKFAQGALKQANCIMDFIAQSVLFYIQPKSLNRIELW
ncbi:hypothetical protein GO684_01595 [Wolbachia endosymbiont of Litomosoides brasiliensis]|uniref:hypothetical protein n=1 Tax=Wolbachia endosymbiont of Litomosoides brasiliensis TaxID=1812117 RepID=UPI00158AEF5E|nr:hypothetical protein [Wolbachia endosymbiont of Litomosoides brasiliensis]NUY39395.1 hypothetical protein [Wolbachia endosymbiont of Litomosoides brasiliensis]